MKDKIYIILIVVFIAVIVYYLFLSFKGNSILNRLSDFLIKADYESFDRLINEKNTIKYAKPFNLDYLKLNKELIVGNKKKINEAFEVFDSVHMNTGQKVAVYQRAYYYYLSNNDIDKTKKYYGLLSQIIRYQGKEKTDITYDTYVEKGYKYLDVVLKDLENAKGEARYEYYALLSDIYQNMNDKENSEKYRKLVESAINKTAE